MSQSGLVGVRIFGNHHAYEGDQPWWTLRFATDLSTSDKRKVAALLDRSSASSDGNFDPPTWTSARQCQWDTCDPWFSNAKAWAKFYAKVDKVFEQISTAQKELLFYEFGHQPKPVYISDAVDWFKKYLL